MCGSFLSSWPGPDPLNPLNPDSQHWKIFKEFGMWLCGVVLWWPTWCGATRGTASSRWTTSRSWAPGSGRRHGCFFFTLFLSNSISKEKNKRKRRHKRDCLVRWIWALRTCMVSFFMFSSDFITQKVYFSWFVRVYIGLIMLEACELRLIGHHVLGDVFRYRPLLSTGRKIVQRLRKTNNTAPTTLTWNTIS